MYVVTYGEGVPDARFVSHGLAIANNVILKICEALPPSIISSHLYLNKTLPDLTPLVGYFRIFDMVRHFHFFLFCIQS